MPTTKKRIPRCWPATPYRRSRFLAPHKYGHMQGRSGGHTLAYAARQLQSMIDYCDNAFAFGMLSIPSVPCRAEDLLATLRSEKGLMYRRRGVTVLAVASDYGISHEEAVRVTTALAGQLPSTADHTVPADVALRCVNAARASMPSRV